MHLKLNCENEIEIIHSSRNRVKVSSEWARGSVIGDRANSERWSCLLLSSISFFSLQKVVLNDFLLVKVEILVFFGEFFVHFCLNFLNFVQFSSIKFCEKIVFFKFSFFGNPNTEFKSIIYWTSTKMKWLFVLALCLAIAFADEAKKETKAEAKAEGKTETKTETP